MGDTESLRLEKTSKIVKSNRQPNTISLYPVLLGAVWVLILIKLLSELVALGCCSPLVSFSFSQLFHAVVWDAVTVWFPAFPQPLALVNPYPRRCQNNVALISPPRGTLVQSCRGFPRRAVHPAAAQAGHTDRLRELCGHEEHLGAAGAVKRTGTLGHIEQSWKDQAKRKATSLSRKCVSKNQDFKSKIRSMNSRMKSM